MTHGVAIELTRLHSEVERLTAQLARAQAEVASLAARLAEAENARTALAEVIVVLRRRVVL